MKREVIFWNRAKLDRKMTKKTTITILMMLILINIVIAAPIIHSIQQTDPLELGSEQTIIAYITGEIDYVNIIIEEQEYEMILENELYTYSWTPTETGTITYTIHAKDINDEITEQENSFTVQDTTPPNVISTSPSGTVRGVDLVISATTDEEATCKYDTNDIDYNSMTNEFNDFGTEHNKTINVEEGTHTYYVRCADSYNNVMESSATISFTADNTPPTIISASPTGTVNDEETTITAETDEEATCKYDTTDKIYDEMEYTLATINNIQHTGLVTGLEEGTKTYYLRCKDNYGNKVISSYQLTFDVNLRPTASISIEEDTPLKDGTYKVTITTSEDLIETPILEYNFNDDTAKKPISLVGEDRSWYGYMIIPDSNNERIGTFHFSGVDKTNQQGTEIKSGKVFLVDTEEPGAIESIKIEDRKDEIKISWHYAEGDDDYYNIYKSTEPGVEKIDFHKDIGKDVFYDDDIEYGTSYYYKVAVVDEAGNDGELSKEVYVVHLPKEEEKPTQKLDPELAYRLNQSIGEVEKYIMDVDWIVKKFERETDKAKLAVINELDLVTISHNMKSNLEDAKKQLEGFREQDLTADEMDRRTQKILRDAEDYFGKVPQTIDISNQLEYQETTEKEIFENAVNQFLLGLDITEEQREEFVKKSDELQKEITVNTKLVTAMISYESEKKDYSIIQKSITSKKSLENVAVIEIIPKEVARDANEITFKTNPTILEKDPIVQWDYNSLSSEEISYSIDRITDLNQLQEVRSIVLQKLGGESENDSSLITGSVTNGVDTKPKLLTALIILGSIIVISLLMYYLFFMDDVKKKSFITGFIGKIRNKRILPENKNKIVDPEFDERLVTAHEKADKMDFQKAYDDYVKLLESFEGVEFESEQKRVAAEHSLNQLYAKLTLFNHITKCHGLVDSREVVGLGDSIEGVNTLLEVIEEESPLTDFAKRSADYFQKALESLDFPYSRQKNKTFIY
jgi:hypothetical protein